MEQQHEQQIAPEIVQAIIAEASARGLSVNDYLRQALGLKNGTAHVLPRAEEEPSLAGTAWEDAEHLMGVFDSREPSKRQEMGQDCFSVGVVADLARQGIKLP